MPNEKEIAKIKTDLASESGAGDQQKDRTEKPKEKRPQRRTALRAWNRASSSLLDAITETLETPTRDKDEKEAVAETSFDLANKYLSASAYAEEIAFASVILPLGFSIFMDWRDKKNEEQTHLVNRPIGEREVISSQGRDQSGETRKENSDT